MPQLTLLHVGLLAGMLLAGFVLGWWYRSDRARREKMAITAGWQAQLDVQHAEVERLATQSQNLMQQISQYQASNKDSKMRAKELSDSLKEAFQRRDELQRQLKDIRGNLEVAIVERDKLQSDVTTARNQADVEALAERDARIRKLNQELENWQLRVPPLVERYRQRDLEAQQAEIELEAALARIETLEHPPEADHTRIEPVDSDALPDGLDASNEPHTDTSVLTGAVLDDQMDDVPANEELAEADSGESVEDAAASHDAAGNRWSAAAQTAPAEDTSDAGAAADDIDAIDDTADRHIETEADHGRQANEKHDDSDTPHAVAAADEHESSVDQLPESMPAGNVDNAQAGDTGHDQGVLADHGGDVGNELTNDTGISDDYTAETAPGNGAGFADRIADDYAPGRSTQDNLRLIKGVGPAIEKILNDLGIYRFNQIAEMSEYEIDRVAQQLKGFRSRIYREDWIGQARTLQHDKTRH